MPVSFFFIKDAFPALAKHDVDMCIVDEKLVTICDELRAVFFLSRVMRKERDAIFYFEQDKLAIWFSGATLRYLGPDERSMLMLLVKAQEKARGLAMHGTGGTLPDRQANARWVESTPGILVRSVPSIKDVEKLLATIHPGYQLATIDAQGNENRGNPRATWFPEGLPGAMQAGLAVVMPRDRESTSSIGDALGANILTFTITTRSRLEGHANVVLVLNLIEDNAT